jgi:hypothetical protein
MNTFFVVIRFDSLLILEYLYQNGVKPTIIANGAKNMHIEVPECRGRMIESINCLPSALSELPKMLGLEELTNRGPFVFSGKQPLTKVFSCVPPGKHQFVLPTCLADTVFIDALIHAFKHPLCTTHRYGCFPEKTKGPRLVNTISTATIHCSY